MRKKCDLTHVSDDGKIRMVDVGGKPATARRARAEAVVKLGPVIAARLARDGGIAKGPVLEVARLAGIMAAKRTAELIPLCHPVPLDAVDIETTLTDDRVRIVASARCRHTTGVEMEALTAAAVAALTVYDMCKAAGKEMVIESVRLLEKTGGKSGPWRARSEHARAGAAGGAEARP